VAAERVHQRRSLTDQDVAAPVQHQYRLLVDALDRHEAHRRPGDSFADRFRVGSVVLVPLHIGPHVLRWDEPNRMPELLGLASPMMGTRARLQANQAWRHTFGKRQHLDPAEPSTDDCSVDGATECTWKMFFATSSPMAIQCIWKLPLSEMAHCTMKHFGTAVPGAGAVHPITSVRLSRLTLKLRLLPQPSTRIQFAQSRHVRHGVISVRRGHGTNWRPATATSRSKP
jgi:hypothetical protein